MQRIPSRIVAVALALFACGETPVVEDSRTPLEAFCAIESDPPVQPASTSDVEYTQREAKGCLREACLCGLKSRDSRWLAEGLARCEAVEGGFYASQETVTIRVLARRAGKCVFRAYREIEGGIVGHECTVPLPMKPWPGLLTVGDTAFGKPSFFAGIESACTQVVSCNVMDPSNACGADVPMCDYRVTECAD